MAITGTLMVTPEQLKTQSDAVENSRRQMQGHFDDLKRLIDGSSGFWIGEGGEAHRKLYLSQAGKIEEMLARYREHVQDLQIMAGVYQEAETTAMSKAEMLPVSTLE